ncbi:MAG: SDR family oxidoreductase [Acidobacteriota bacterium]|nr:SDR family oxidoreductase [Acidobacteriota bacterium]
MSVSNPFFASKTALITGASSGIGLELAHLFARDGYRLVLVARSRSRLLELAEDLQSRYSITVRVSPKDLSHPASPAELYQELQEAGILLDVLVNNAGFGGGGAFLETNWSDEAEMLQVNMVAVTHLTKLFLPQIRAREGQVLNVASTAAFQPGPFMAVYYASKAYVLSFSEALAEELEGTKATLTCLCPGPVITNFQKRANITQTRIVHGPLVVDVRDVARIGYEGMKQGKRLVIPGWKNRLGMELLRLSPRKMVTKLVRQIHQKSTSE